jgi:hypothetical protein
MPLLHCSKCHHEWESASFNESCDWCGAVSYVLTEKNPLEKMLDRIKEIGIAKFLKGSKDANDTIRS